MAYVGLIAYAVRVADNWRRGRDRRRTRRIIEGLPASIRKDIGWPDPNPGFGPHARF
jgi:hypothetical protein